MLSRSVKVTSCSFELRKVRSHAFDIWSGPTNLALGNRASIAAMMAVAALIFPEALGGQRGGDGSVVLPFESLPVEVREFGLAGGLNLTLSADVKNVRVSLPRGCVWEYMSDFVVAKSARSNVKDVEAFVCVARSCDLITEHTSGRLLACELSMVGSNGSCPLYDWLASAWKGKGKLAPDPLVFGQPFVYEAFIRDVEWSPHRVYCVSDKAVDKGKRVVDLGFPVWLLVKRNCVKERKRVMCQLKKGYAEAELWRFCWTYFAKMQDFVANNADVLVCFVASTAFRGSGQPVQRTVQEGVSAHDSWQHCCDLMKNDSRFLILDNMVSHSQFPLTRVFEDAAAKSSRNDVAAEPNVRSFF